MSGVVPNDQVVMDAIAAITLPRQYVAKTQVDSPVAVNGTNGNTVFTNSGATGAVIFNVSGASATEGKTRIAFLVISGQQLTVTGGLFDFNAGSISSLVSSTPFAYLVLEYVGNINGVASQWLVIQNRGFIA